MKRLQPSGPSTCFLGNVKFVVRAAAAAAAAAAVKAGNPGM